MSVRHKITLAGLRALKQRGEKFSVLTCYDAATARLMETAGVEILLVGDTAAEVVLGLPGTRDISPEFLLTLTAAVRRGAPNVMLMGDLPYRCRCGGVEETVCWGRRFIDEAGCDCLKVEVGRDHVPLVEAMTAARISVVAHLGLLPQMIEPGESYGARGRTAEAAGELIEQAALFEAAGAAMLLLEAVPSEVAHEIAGRTALPVIGCVGGPHCDGTVVVLHDMLAWGGGHPPRMVRQYARIGEVFVRAFSNYVEDIHAGAFPSEAESIHMKPGELEKLYARTRGSARS